MTEKKRLARLKSGEADAFEEFLDEYGPRLQSLARRYAAPDEADDLTQEIFLAIFKALPDFRGDSSLFTFIYRVALNVCLKWREKNGRATLVSLPENWAETAPDEGENERGQSVLERRELREKLGCALENIGAAHRDIVVLHELHGLSYAQCASVLEIPIGTVKSRLYHAFRALRAELAPYLRATGDTP